jgi:hypothetical protein
MKKIIWGLCLIVATVLLTVKGTYSQNKKELNFYCYAGMASPLILKYSKTEEEIKKAVLGNSQSDWCKAFFYFYNDYIEVPEEVFLKFNQEVESIKTTDPKLKIQEIRDINNRIISKYTPEINSHREIRLKERFKLVEEDLKITLVENKKKEQIRFLELEKLYGKNCNKNNNYNECLVAQDNKAKASLAAKKSEENKKKQLIADKQKVEEDKLNKILAAMKPEERRAHVCEKTYGLRKGSDKFSECVYKILAADVELEKIELQKKLAEAQLETAKANEAAARANAAASASRGNVSGYDPNVAAAMDRANEIERAKILLNLSQALRTPSASPQFNAPPRQQNCKLNPYNNRITCY